MRIVLCLAVAAAVLLLAFNSTDAVTTASVELPGGGRYVALGSSYAAGPGIAPMLGGGCGRSGRNYASLVAEVRHLRLIDEACDGATTSNILTAPQRTRSGAVMPPQIDAVTTDTQLVTVTIGGNDVGYIAGMITDSWCAVTHNRYAGTRCHKPVTEPTRADFDRVQALLTLVVREIRARAPHAQVVLVDYLPVLVRPLRPCASVPLTPRQQAMLQHSYDSLVEATAGAARATGAVLVQASDETAHTPCTAAPWVTGFQRPMPYHPNAAGMSAVAQLVLAAL